jgi:uncharacterized repeat protein (TIGR01451 family)
MQQHIKALSRFRIVAWFALAIAFFGVRASAQVNFGASVSHAAITTNLPFTYTMGVTNFSATLQTVRIRSTILSAGTLEVDTNSLASNYAVSVTNDSQTLLFTIPNIQSGSPAVVTFSVWSTNAIAITNRFDLSLGTFTNVFTNITLVTLVTNIPAVQTDLGLSVTGPGPDVYVGDWITLGVVVTNRGPNSATSVVLSNRFPAAIAKSITPANQFTNGISVVNLGTLTNRATRSFKFTVQATNFGSMPFTATLTSAAQDPSSTNNSATTNILVSAFLTNNLVATVVSNQTFNGVMGVFDQQIALSNASSASVPSARINVAGIPSANRLFNAVGTNNGLPFVVYPTNLNAGQAVGLTLQFRIPSYQTFSNLTLTANAMTNAADLRPPEGLIPLTVSGSSNSYTRITNWLGNILIEFPTTNGRSYTIVYDDTPAFTNPKAVRPPIVAPANWTYWIDYGPPATTGRTIDSSSRYYRVFLNP